MRRPLVAALLAGLALLLAAPAASAHALLRGSDPAGGASLPRAPEKVTLNFTEPPDLTLSSVHVLDSGGKAVESGKARAVPGKPLSVEVPLGRAPNGAYTVSWRTVSKADGHLTSGSFAFGVGVRASSATSGGAPEAVSSPAPSVLGVAGRWAFDWGLILLVGGVAGSLLVFRRRDDGPPLALLGGALVLSVAGLVAVVVSERSRVGVSFGDLFGSPTGGKLIDQGMVLLVTAIVFGAVTRWPRRAELLALLGVGAAATMLVHVAGGHAAGEASLTPLHILVQWAHLLAVGVWVGGFLWLLLGLRGARAMAAGPEPPPGNGLRAIMRLAPAHAALGGKPAPGASAASQPAATAVMTVPGPDERVPAVRRFSTMATVALGVVALTGLVRALIEVGSWHGLYATSFGRTLLVKLALVAGLVVLGAVNRFRIVPALRAGRAKVATLGSAVRAELALAIPIVVAAAVLGELPPAQYLDQPSTRQQARAAVTVRGNDFATSVKVELTATPGTVGANRFSAKVVDYDSGQPVQATRVSLRFTLPNRPDIGASALQLKKAPDGRWQGQGILSIAGRWSITTLVERPGGSVTVPLELEPRGTTPQVKVSRVPGQPTVYTIALQRGGSLQTYLDPGRPGPNVLHMTYFTAGGAEQPIFQIAAKATNSKGAVADLTLSKFSSGHYVSNLKLDAGRWSFEINATTKEGDLTDARFEQVIQP
ncbi:MAG TPA: copper resistance protein CopC [Actinomycetota bacterium]|nr:copper resistance protein CopC [Actinomycetota bacterium]